VNMPVDIKELWTGGGLSDPDKEVRDAAVDGAKTWIDVALAVGSKSVRCDPGKINPEDLSPTSSPTSAWPPMADPRACM